MENKINEEENMTYNEIEKKVYSLVCALGCEIIKQILETQDRKLMDRRNKKEYRHKGYRKNTIKTIMGEVEYERSIYLQKTQDKNKYVYLLDNIVNINTIGNFSYNLVEKMLETTVTEISYRKATNTIKNITNETISHEALRNIVCEIGKKIENKELEQVNLLKEEKLPKGKKEIKALFEEADGIWINLQGKDRKEGIEKYKKECEKKGIIYKGLRHVKTELKLHVMYEGWKRENNRYQLINKTYTAGMLKPKILKEIRNAKVYGKYNEKKICLRVMNGDGAKWISNMATKDTISQKDKFHIKQEIVRSVKEEPYRQILFELFENKRYKEIPVFINALKYECGGEEKIVKKLENLKRYLSVGLPRYVDILKEQNREIPKPVDGVEYREMGTMESQIFTVLKVRMCSGRKSWSKQGSNYLSKICALYIETKQNINLKELETPIEIDNSVEKWIKQIEQNVKKNKRMHRADRKEISINNYAQSTVIEKTPQIKELLKLLEPTALIYR